MADPSNSTVFHVLAEALRTSNLSDLERQRLWLQATSGTQANSVPASHIPRSVARQSRAHVSQYALDLSRSRSAPLPPAANNNQDFGVDMTLTLSAQPTVGDNYMLCSQPGDQFLRPIGQSINGGNLVDGMTVYTPQEFIDTCIDPSIPSLSLSTSFNQSQQNADQVMQNVQWCPSLAGSMSPSIHSAGAMTPATMPSSGMSRLPSYDPQFLDIATLHMQPFPSPQPVLYEDGASPFPFSDFDVVNSNINACLNASLPLVGSSNQDFPSSYAPVSAPSFPLEASQHSFEDTNTQRSTSISSASSATSSDTTIVIASQQTRPRHLRRARELAVHSTRPLAPKTQTQSPSPTQSATTSPSNTPAPRAIPKSTSARRPTRAKVFCQHCNSQPTGFRGVHELERHVLRYHSRVRKGFICVDASDDGKFLSKCKKCKGRKVYGAYYNAAAHLRRAHFYPRQKGGCKEGDRERRGGIGGGDDPPMDVLKTWWIREVDVVNGKVVGEGRAVGGEEEPGMDVDVDAEEVNTQQDGLSGRFQVYEDVAMSGRMQDWEFEQFIEQS
ncbi:hypothetical protein M011DRAFT_455637 [Sporormia fimetaria CBS 119925]|uniref:DUF7896 domain-containing protein n=1 Tax=Sporormia fimetaria CBS 119925 TaxID=1340428 RepID=A0A6A6VLE1_9PLEO|nr:hypothetical protein M011DRAFT_455637 [Sporormia fimetaria CBS 119925]